jgi:demethoxyubiquinone hydroxylase (CLK1/Coq7/Cat5 family)
MAHQIFMSTSSPTPPNSLCVYYDGACPLCRAEIATYQRAEGGESLQWIDASGCNQAELGPDLDRTSALARLHIRRPDGTLLQGAAAFVAIWSALPGWRWLAQLAKLPGALFVMDVGYNIFLKLRPLWRPVAQRLPLELLRELRTDHAGETGAVMIYRGVLAVSRDAALRAFAQHHLETEQRHLDLIEQVISPRWHSRLLPVWRISGWLTGALPACFGPRAVYATIQAVETFVDKHYAQQTTLIDALLGPSASEDMNPELRTELLALRATLEQCRLDEVAHRDDAAGRWDGRSGIILRAWRGVVAWGSESAVGVCRHV